MLLRESIEKSTKKHNQTHDMAKIGNQGGANIPPPLFYATAKHWLPKMTHKKNITANKLPLRGTLAASQPCLAFTTTCILIFTCSDQSLTDEFMVHSIVSAVFHNTSYPIHTPSACCILEGQVTISKAQIKMFFSNRLGSTISTAVIINYSLKNLKSKSGRGIMNDGVKYKQKYTLTVFLKTKTKTCNHLK